MVMAETLSRRSPIKVGFYDIVKTIGRGNFAEVKLAKHRITKTEVAIKIIDKRRLDQLNLKKIYREIQILKLLNHQHIIKLYQVMETSSTIYLVCEYARNGELFDFITEQGRLPEDKAKKMFWQVLTAVEYCHKNNVVHRDLKAENLLLDSNNNIKLADFGFSNFYQSGNMLSTWCGSPPYAAPEVFEGKLYEGPHLDIWSLGIVLYVLVCGTFPFDGSNLATLKERVLAGRFRIPFWMSQDCENLVRRMLVLNPKKRLTIAQIKKHKWMQSHIVNSNAVLSHTKSSSQLPRRGKLSEYNENVLKIMQGLGIDQQKTLDSLNTSAYDHLFAIYQLLVDRLKTHRTSYPHDVTASCNSGRRPSNVADQAVASISHKNRRGAYPDFTTTANTVGQSMRESTLPEMRFDDMTTGLPVIQRSFVNPLRYTSPPLPQIKTSLYEEDQTQENETMLSCHSSLSPSNHVSENGILAFNYQISNLQLPASIHQDKNEIEEIEMEGYNLQKRRHSLMVPNPSSLLFPSGTTRRAAQCSPINSAMKLNKSGDDVYFKQCASGSGYTHHPESSVNKQPELSYAKKSNVLLPSGIPAQSDNRSAYQPNRRRSGVSPLVRNCSPNSNSPGQEHEISEANTMYSTERHHLNASPIGFREGRRASDGLLLLANSSLKEHLQKLSRTKAVPEMAQEDSHESWESNDASSVTNQLQVPNSMNRCRSGDRVYTNHSMGTPSHSASPSGSGSSFCFQPYNNLSIAKRKSLQVPILQISGISSQNQSDEQQFNDLCSKDQLPENFQNLVSHIVPDPASANLIETSETSFHWSSWKPVVKSSFTDGEEVKLPPGKWQQFNSSINGNRQDEPSLIGKVAFSVASDEALPSKAAAAQQQQQRDSMTKPIRQQSLPINSTSNAYSFGVAPTHNQSLAQLLQQRRLQRRLKVATHNQHIPGYNLPLSELEQLKIDNSDALNHFKTYQLQNTLTTFPFPPNLDLNDSNQLNQTQQLLHYATAVYTNEFTDNNPYKNESVLPVSGDYPVQEMLSFHNNQTFYENNELMSQSSYRLSPSHAMFPTSSPNAADTDNPWSYDSKVMYRNCNVMPFNNLKFYDVEGLTSSTEKLDQTMNENMEFALY